MSLQPEQDANTPRSFIESIFAMEERGYVVLAFIPHGGGAARHAHVPVGQWEIAEKEIAHYSETHNCYVAVALYVTQAHRKAGVWQYRTKEMVGHMRWLYADLDAARVPSRLPEPTMLIETSPGRQQAWWQLDAPIRWQQAEDLLRRIAKACHIGNEAVDATRILRIPGTINRKEGRSDAVVKHIGGSGASYPIAPFATLPEAAHYYDEPIGPVAHITINDADLLSGQERLRENIIPDYLQHLLMGKNVKHDPSRNDWACICGLMEIGLTDKEAAAVFAHSARGVALNERKGEHRFEYLLDHLVTRARSKVGMQPEQDHTEEPDGETDTARRYRLYTDIELENLKPPPFLIDDLLPARGLISTVGASGSYKTFGTLHMALCIATGTKYFGKVVRQAPIIYVAAEAQAGFGMRVKAWKTAHGIESVAGFFAILEAPQLLTEDDETTLIRTIRDLGSDTGMIVFDTRSRTFTGDENSVADVGAYINACDRIGRATGWLVNAVHHHGKAGTTRGSSAWYAALDGEITFDYDTSTKIITQSITKAKDWSSDWQCTLSPSVVELGSDEDGKPRSSVVLIVADAPYEPTRVNERNRKAIVALYGKTNPGMGYNAWHRAMGGSEASLRRAKNDLFGEESIEQRGEMWFVTPSGLRKYAPFIERNNRFVQPSVGSDGGFNNIPPSEEVTVRDGGAVETLATTVEKHRHIEMTVGDGGQNETTVTSPPLPLRGGESDGGDGATPKSDIRMEEEESDGPLF